MDRKGVAEILDEIGMDSLYGWENKTNNSIDHFF
jgi:hypothetical protein